jgi:hypothetical protein
MILTAWLLAGCSMFAGAPPADPQPCGEVYGTQRCLAMTDEAASRTGRTRDDVTAIDIVPFPTTQDGVLITRSGGGFKVRLTLRDGTTTETPMCGGIPSGAACMDAPRLEARTSVGEGGGYHDVPCPDDAPPRSCGTPLPTLEAPAVAAARPLSVARFPIRIDHVGSYRVSLGEASLPNGIVTVASFAFADDWPLNVSLKDGVAPIGLRSLEPDGKPFLWFEKGAVLGIRDVVVR